MKEFCVDLEIAKELKENGFSQGENFYWIIEQNKPFLWLCDYYIEMDGEFGLFGEWNKLETYYAPTSDEILKELPNFITIENYVCILHINRALGGTFYVYYGGVTKISPVFKDKKLSNILSELWIWGRKEGYIK